jgi:cytochrome P450 family 138
MTAVALPPGSTWPRPAQGLVALTARNAALRRLRRRYGDAFTVDLPVLGPALVVTDPAQVKQVFTSPPEVLDTPENSALGRVLGPRSLFALQGEAHRQQRKLLVPPFHGRRLGTYAPIVEEETRRELATWPAGRPVPMLPSALRITLNVILRAVFGAQDAELDRLRAVMPRAVELGSRIAFLPRPARDLGRFDPWARLAALRREFDGIVERLVAVALADPALADRADVLALLAQTRHEDGSRMSAAEISDHLLTLLTAGHETTATTLAWAVERLARHPDVLARLVAEADAGGEELLAATVLETQRTRPVIDWTARTVRTDTLALGPYVLRRGQRVVVSIKLVHDDDAVFPDAARFDPDRFVGVRPDLYRWIPFGGGTRRCLGAAFADLEMRVVLRTLLRSRVLAPTAARGERWHYRGIAYAPARGGRVVSRPR